MKKWTTTMIHAALAGMLLGTTSGCDKGDASGPKAGVSGSSPASGAKHACRGQNACKGQGGCATDMHGCKGQNACKGQGGCGMS
jgi:hypothetical protein